MPRSAQTAFTMLLATIVTMSCGGGSGGSSGISGLAGGLGVSIPFMPTTPETEPEPAPAVEIETIEIVIGPTADDVELDVSRTIRETLASMNLLTRQQIAEWFNEPTEREDPFAPAMEAELRKALGSWTGSSDLADLELSAATRRVLEQLGVNSVAALRNFDLARLSKERLSQTACRAEIVQRMRMDGWTSLLATVANPARASSLSLNGRTFGSIRPLSAEVERQFLVWLPGDSSDGTQIVTLSVDLPGAKTGLPGVRWFRDIELRRRGETRISVSAASAPVPSIGYEPTRRLSPAAVYAGDEVDLFVEAGSDDTIWVFFANTDTLDARSYKPVPAGSASFSGLPAWLELRSLVSAGQSGRRRSLDGSSLPTRVIGRGQRITWRPDSESPNALVAALVRGPDGFWGLASRSIAVADLRPGIFLLPDLPLERTPEFLEDLDKTFRNFSPLSIYRTHWALERLTYETTLPGSVDFDVLTDDLFDASIPLQEVVVDFGDGSPVMRLSGDQARRARISHAYAAAGRYTATLTSVDSMGLSRSQTTTVKVNPAPAAAEPSPLRIATPEPRPVAPRPPPRPVPAPAPSRSVERGVGTYDLLNLAIRRLANDVAETFETSAARRTVSLAQVLDNAERGAFDLVDHALVSTLLARGATVVERDSWFLAGLGKGGLLVASEPVAPDAEGLQTPRSEVAITCKIRRMELRVLQVGDLSIRTARILAFVRLHDTGSGRILADRLFDIDMSDSQSSEGVIPEGSPWNGFPDGYLMRRFMD